MRFMKTTAVALALAVGGLSTPIASPLTATDAEASHRKAVHKHVRVKHHGKRVVKKVVVRRAGVRYVNGHYWYGGRYYDHDQALAAGLIGFTFGLILSGALAR